MSISDEGYDDLHIGRAAAAIAIGMVSGFALVVLPYSLVWLQAAITDRDLSTSLTAVSGFNTSLTLVFPFVQGLAMAIALGRKRYNFGMVALLSLALLLIELFGAALFMHEGIICLIILSPIVFILIVCGAAIGRALIAWRARASRTLQVSLVPLIFFAVLAEAAGPRPDHVAAVTDSVTINASPEYVWRYIVQYPENTSPPEYWLWRIGLPAPIQSVAEAPRIGATRLCRFSNGVAFEERIVELVPNRVLTFDVTRQPNDPEVLGHFRFERGQIQLTPNRDGSTTVTATSRYRLFVRPAAYFDLWTVDITRNIHFRVLNHIKRLAEHDYADARRPQN
jgi:uncharacterized protein YndB with AHSA1/START domain